MNYEVIGLDKPDLSIYSIIGSGYLGMLGWASLGVLLILGIAAIILPNSRQKQMGNRHWFFSAIHIQFIVFTALFPYSHLWGSYHYMTLNPIPDVIANDMVEALASIFIEVFTCLILGFGVYLRHKAKPDWNWLTVLCVTFLLLDLMFSWAIRMVGEIQR